MKVENGVPHRSVISPILFSVMVNDIYSAIVGDIGRSLFADDGAMWKWGRSRDHIMKNLHKAIDIVAS